MANLVAAGSSLRSRSSGSSTSSLSSTFSDITSSTSASSSPPNLKTNAFFASPFSTRPPSPTLPTPAAPPQKPRSLTAEFFGTPVRPPSPPASSISSSSSSAKQKTPHLSRIFPSRYTSVSDRSSDLYFDSITDADEPPPKFIARERAPSTGSESSFTSSLHSHSPRLPTPPPQHPRTPHREDTITQQVNFPATPTDREESYDEPTPRPANLQPQPGLLRFERDLILEAQAKEKAKQLPKPPPPPPDPLTDDGDGLEDEEPHPGSIISLPSPDFPLSFLPLSPLSLTFTIASPSPTLNTSQLDRGTPTPTNEFSTPASMTTSISSTRTPSPELKPLPSPPPSLFQTSQSSETQSPATRDTDHAQAQVPKLRLLRPLGHGAFSAVWLAEDLSRVPLTLVSKKSVRDLRRRASGRREKGKERAEKRGGGERSEGDGLVMMDREGMEGESDGDVRGGGVGDGAMTSKKTPNRIREGLKNMLSFSRSTVSPGTSGALNNSKLLGQVEMDVDVDVDEGEDRTGSESLSRNSSSKSISSNSSVDPGISVSRQSSVHSRSSKSGGGGGGGGGGPSRKPSLRLSSVSQQDMTLSRDSSLKKFRERVRGTRPAFLLGRAYLDERHGEMGEPRGNADDTVLLRNGAGDLGRNGEMHTSSPVNINVEDGESLSDGGVGLGASLSRQSSLGTKSHGRLIAVKMTPRKPHSIKGREREEEERSRVGFVREVEVLKHISHPNITPLLAHLSTASQHILVLPYLPGGDLLGLVNNDVAWSKLGESVLRRIWCEICKAVGWMHGVGLVHRDIKLENILLTTSAFTSLTPLSPRPTLSTLPEPPAPFIKLTDFGLSRFVEIDANGDAELLSTRCGSEAYAAPELVTGGGGGPNGAGVYDARKTDAWACGVVLFALVGRQLPFGEGPNAVGEKTKFRIGGERGKEEAGAGGGGGRGGGGRRTSAADRRHWLMRIARGEWEWPGEEVEAREGEGEGDVDVDELVGPRLVKSRGARRIVSRLLVRDPKKRARIGDLWDDAWMQGGEDEAWWRKNGMELDEEESRGDVRLLSPAHDAYHPGPGPGESENLHWTFDGNGEELRDDVDVEFYDEPTHFGPLDGPDEEGEEYEDEDEGGCLFDHEGIDSIARQEVI